MTPKRSRTEITRRRLGRYIDVVFGGSSTEFARFVGMGESTISRIIAGVRQPRGATVQRMSNGMTAVQRITEEIRGAPLEWLTGDVDTYSGAYMDKPDWYNMLSDHHSVATKKDFDFLKSIEGTSEEAKSL
ncbi:MAG: helix-turn-helix transcriptional regulator, partial [Gemmatimonadetes bacterium]|nr:helix-turn-helix transcriptional regulator [Gemmatimonadota bacterium]